MHVHVQYFGDKGRHGWVAESAMIPFTGRRDFDKLAIASEAAKAGLKKKEKNTGFIVKPFIVPKWEIAIYEAEEVLPLSNDERTERFNPQKSKTKYEKLLELAKSEVKKEKGGKRERSDESPGPAPKRLKRESLSTVSTESKTFLTFPQVCKFSLSHFLMYILYFMLPIFLFTSRYFICRRKSEALGYFSVSIFFGK